MRPVRGMKDLLSEDFSLYNHIENVAYEIAKLYGFTKISTPILEYSNIYSRTLGDTSDVVNKEMYSFLDRGGDNVTLRPEFTAGIMRAVISNGLIHNLPLRFFSSGPVFRYDRPQAGRQRQFHQANFELIGLEASPFVDSEIIKLACHFLDSINLLSNLKLEINSLGCFESREKYQSMLVEYLDKYKNELSDDSKNRLEKNPLRILDSKSEIDKKILETAPVIEDSYSKESKDFFEKLKELLNILKINYIVNPKLVRGLDYYCHTAFEFISNNLGSQSTVLGGGRYDNLSKIMSGKYNLPSVGFAAGIERLALLSEYSKNKINNLAIITVGQGSYEYSLKIASLLRENNISTILYSPGKFAKKIDQAVKENCNLALFIGEDDIKKETFNLKNLVTGEESNLSMENIINILKNK